MESPARNASLLQEHIEELRRQSGTGSFSLKGRADPEYFAHAQSISDLFRSLKPLAQQDRERLWREFNEIRDAVRRQRENLARNSRQKRELVEGRIREAQHWANGAQNKEHLYKADEILKQALAWMKDGWQAFTGTTEFFESIAGNEGILLKEDREACWQLWKEAKETLHYRRQEIPDFEYGRAKADAYAALAGAQTGNPHEALNLVKSWGQSLASRYMNKLQREDIRDVLDKAWKIAISRIETDRDERRRKHDQWVEGQRRWIGNQESWILGRTEQVEKAQQFITRLEAQIDDLQDKLAGARTDDFANRVRGWIEEKYDKIAEVNRQISDLEEKIRDAQSRVAEARHKLNT